MDFINDINLFIPRYRKSTNRFAKYANFINTTGRSAVYFINIHTGAGIN